MTGADNQLITVRVRQVSADLGYINIDICPDIGKVSVYGRWALIRWAFEPKQGTELSVFAFKEYLCL